MGKRVEHDSMGTIEVEEHALWGAQTQRSLQNFSIGEEKMPIQVIYALAKLKAAAAKVNLGHGKLTTEQSEAIVTAVEKILSGEYDAHFPLSVWQTGSGTQSNMNVNEVICHIAKETFPSLELHPNDHVNMGQSSNDVFPSAMHIAAYEEMYHRLLPTLERLKETFDKKSTEYRDLIKIGRTHLQDATPLTLGQEIGAWSSMLAKNIDSMKHIFDSAFLGLAIGGTAVGTGVNTSPDFGKEVCQILSESAAKYYSEPDKFYALTSRSNFVEAHASLESLASNLFKISNDVRFLAMGPRAGLAEITIPANEPGSSIMPGKVNPTQSEQMSMVCIQVMSNQHSISFAASQGHFQLNVYAPLIIHNFLQSIRLLSDSVLSFHDHCAIGITANEENIQKHLDQSLMLVTALSPAIGYKKAASIAKMAFVENKSLLEITQRETDLSDEKIKNLLNPKNMI